VTFTVTFPLTFGRAHAGHTHTRAHRLLRASYPSGESSRHRPERDDLGASFFPQLGAYRLLRDPFPSRRHTND
jgi:hypothetical protein